MDLEYKPVSWKHHRYVFLMPSICRLQLCEEYCTHLSFDLIILCDLYCVTLVQTLHWDRKARSFSLPPSPSMLKRQHIPVVDEEFRYTLGNSRNPHSIFCSIWIELALSSLVLITMPFVLPTFSNTRQSSWNPSSCRCSYQCL